jgi:class 3 adenylate cyclase
MSERATRDTAKSRVTGAFVDRELEAEFQRENQEPLARFLSFSVPLTSLVYLAYGVHDWLLVPEAYQRAWIVRYGLFLPVSIGVLVIVRSPKLSRLVQPAMFVYGVAASLVVLYIGVIARLEGFFLYTSYAVLFATIGPFIARMNVTTQSVYTLTSVVLYNVLDAVFHHSPSLIRTSISITLFALGGIGAVLAHRLEVQARDAFLQRKLIGEHAEALDIEKSRAEALLLNVLPPSIAERLKSDKGAIADGFAQVSVLFADIVGFTQMSERLKPEEVVFRLNLIFSSFDDLVDKLKLEKIKTIGDSYMVAGGLHSHEYDHAQTIAEMALAMRRRMTDFSTQFGEPLSLRIGINTGSVVAGVIGKKKFIYDVWGDTVNTASRMESHAQPNSIQVTEATYALLRDRYDLVDRGEVEVKGKGRMRTWILEGAKDQKGKPMAFTQQPQRKARTEP